MDVYSKVAKEVGPKKQKLAEMNAKLEKANGLLKEKQDELKAVRDRVAGLKAKLDATLQTKEDFPGNNVSVGGVVRARAKGARAKRAQKEGAKRAQNKE